MSKTANGLMNVLVQSETLEAVKIAAAYRGMSMGRYADAVLLHAARCDIEEGHREWTERGRGLAVVGGGDELVNGAER